MKKLLFFLFIASLSLISCSEADNDLTPELTFPQETSDFFVIRETFANEASEKTISFTSNVPWSVSIDETRDGTSWLHVSPESGSAGENTIKLSVDENAGYDDRSAAVRMTYGGEQKCFYVTQKQKDALTLTTNRFEVPAYGETIEIEIAINVGYEVVVADECQEWVHQKTSLRGLVTKLLKFVVDPSDEYGKREGKIDIVSGEKKETVMIYQAGAGPELTLTQNEFNLSNSAHDVVIEVSSNFEYGVEIPDADWVFETTRSGRGVSTHTLNLHVNENTTYDQRTACVRVYDKNSDLSETITIRQSQKDALLLEQKEYSFDANGGTFTVDLKSNVDYKVAIGESWITEVPASASRGLVAHSHTFNVTGMTSHTDREAKITFSDPNTGITGEVVVKQANLFYLDKESVEIINGETKKLSLTNKTGSDVIWESSNTSVATVDANGNVKAVAPGNATITVSTKDGKNIATCNAVVCTVESKVTLSGGACQYSQITIGGYTQTRSGNKFTIKNDLPSSISVTNFEYYYNGKSLPYSTSAFNVSAGSSKTWDIETGSTIYDKVICKVTFKYNNKTYTVKNE